jgi:tetratricopeptide (TPR) repeat protein
VLITSRRRLLALDDARTVSLDTLLADDAADLLVRLAARPSLEAQDAGVREIARLCGYLPLAIGMLARQLHHHPSWTVGDVTGDLAAARDRLEVMAAENISVAAAFDLSYADLTGAQQRMFRYLGLHPGTDIDAYAAAALADDDLGSARATLAALYDHYLLTELARGRYRMHDLVREHARRAASEYELADKDTARTRLLDYYLHTARDASQRLETSTGAAMPEPPGARPAYAPTFADRASATSWLASERLNLHAAAEEAAGAGHGGYVVGIAAAMQPYLRSHGHWGQAIALHEAALRFALETENEFCQAYTLKNLGAMQRMTDDYAGASSSLELALRLFTGLGDLLGQADTLMNIGAVQRSLGDPASAIASVRAALELYRTASNDRGESAALNHLGQAQLTAGDHPAAIPTFTRAIELSRRIGDQIGEANALSSLANAQRRMGEHQAAISSARRAIALARALGDRYQALAALNTIGLAQLEVGDDLASVDSFSEVLREAEELGVRRAVATALNNLSQAHLTLGNFPLATSSVERALSVHREIGDRRGEAETLNNLAELPGPTATQRVLAAEALVIARDIASPSQEARALELLGLSHLAGGETAEASEFLRQSLETYQRIGTPAPERVRQALADLGG